MSLLLALQTGTNIPPPAAKPEPYRPAPATIVAEPVALLLAGFDRDGDGRTTAAEARAGVEAMTRGTPAWSTGIGYLAYSDWAERWLGDRNAVPTPFEADRDGDGRVTLTELGDRIETLFARFDADKDGAVTRKELLTIRAAPFGDRPGGRRERRELRERR